MQQDYYEDGIYYYQGLPDDLDNLKSYNALKDLISPPLTDEQSVDLLRALFIQRYCLLYETGMGKTYVASAYMKALQNASPGSKFLMIVKRNQDIDTPRKVREVSGLSVKFFTAEENSLVNGNSIEKYDVIMITHDSLSSELHMRHLLNHINRFRAIIVDEAHLLSNIEEASSAFMLYCLSHRVKYFLSLTATPITTNLEQLPRLMKVTAPNEVKNFKKLCTSLKSSGMSGLPSKFNDLFVIRSRSMNLHQGYAEFIEPMTHQRGAKGRDLFLVTKGEGATKQADWLVNKIRSKRPFKGLVYCNRTEVYNFIVPYLRANGISCNYINGKKLEKDRKTIVEEFRNNEYDVLITNAKESLDLDCEYVIFYEYTVHVKQFIGRAERGINPKPLDVIFLFTKDTDEYDYFVRNIYEISQEVQEILGIDFREVTSLKYKKG